MKMSYYVNKNANDNGYHEIHQEGCKWMPNDENAVYLGKFNNCHEAYNEALKLFSKVDGCYYCCRPCHHH